MRQRRLIGEQDKWVGVEWTDSAGHKRILFAFAPVRWHIGKSAKVKDLMTGREIEAKNVVLKAEAWHVYAVEK